MRNGAEGERCLASFAAVKAAVDDNVEQLRMSWEDSIPLQQLCDEISGLVRSFEIVEEWSPIAFTPHVSTAGTLARREYDDRWRQIVSFVADRDFRVLFSGIFADDLKQISEANGGRVQDQLASDITNWTEDGRRQASDIEYLIDYIVQIRSLDDDNDLEWADDALRAWDRLKIAGLDLVGILWRRRALPHILVPTHVARHYGDAKVSLYRRLHQAGRAFVFGAPLAALALQRAVIEEVLSKHWGAEKGMVRNANLPTLEWDARAERLKRMANTALHGDADTLKGDQLDRAIIENFLILRLLIENAPQQGTRRVSKL